MPVKIKICGLTNLADARHAWQCGADLLGFIFVPSSPRYVTPATVAAMIEHLHAEGCRARCVGVFANERPEVVREVAGRCRLDLVQLHGDEPPAEAETLGLPVIRAWRVRGPLPWGELARYPAWAYLLDSYDPQRLGGTGSPWRWDLLPPERAHPERILIAGGLTPANVAEAIRQTHPWGVDVSSGVEARPGLKDPLKVARFIQFAQEVRYESDTNDSLA